MSDVIVGEGEDFEAALRRFNKRVQLDGTLRAAKRRRYHEKPSDKRRRQHAARLRKLLKKKLRAEARMAQRSR
ncbi:MAG: 30S ribosomal protein S21 [Dehalococcoidia bacterium]